MVPIQEKQLIATTKVPLEVGKEEVKWHFTSFLSEFSEKGAVEKQISCVSSAQVPSPRHNWPTQLRGAGNNCLKPISKNFNTSISATNASINNKQLQKQHNIITANSLQNIL